MQRPDRRCQSYILNVWPYRGGGMESAAFCMTGWELNMEKKKNFNIYKLLTVILAILLIAVLAVFGRSWMIQRNAEKEYERLADQVNHLQGQLNDNAIGTSVPEETERADSTENTEDGGVDTLTSMGIDVPQKNLDWTSIAEVNPDIYAWIYIPGTEVDYPILQHPTDDSYYLNYNMNGTKGYPGCIYTERANSKDFTDFQTVVYGHNMRNDSMFASLHDLEDHSFFANCPYVYVYTGDKVLVYEIFAAYTADDSHILHTNDFTTEEGRQQYLEKTLKNSSNSGNMREDVEVLPDSHILTLSTCVRGKSKNRFLVQAVLINEDAL